MIRGAILIGRAPGDFTSKARPYLVVQAAATLDASPTLTVCPVTTQVIGIGRIRVAIAPTSANGLEHASEVEVDRITTMRRDRFDAEVGHAEPGIVTQVDASLRRWLDL